MNIASLSPFVIGHYLAGLFSGCGTFTYQWQCRGHTYLDCKSIFFFEYSIQIQQYSIAIVRNRI